MISTILLIVAFLVVAACTGISVWRGFCKSVLRGGAVLLSALSALITSLILRAALSDLILDMVKNTSDEIGNILRELNDVSPVLMELIPQLLGALIAPIIFLLLFFAFWLIFGITAFILKLVFRKKMGQWEQKILMPRLIAAAIGLVEGLLIVGVFLLPVSSYLSLARPAVDGLVEQGIIEAEGTTKDVLDIVREADDAPVLVVHRVLGGQLASDTLMNVTVSGARINLRKEMEPIMGLVVSVAELSETELKSYDVHEADLIRSMGESFGKSNLLTVIVGDVLYAATDAWLEGEAFLEVEKPDMGESAEMFDPFLNKLLSIVRDDAKKSEQLQKDVQTLADIIAILAQNKVIANLENQDKLVETLGGEGVVKSMIQALGANESMKPLIPEVTNLGVRAIGQVLNIPANADEVYGDFMDEVAAAINATAALSEAQRVENLTEQLATAFDEAGIAIDREILDFYSASMLHDLVENNDREVTAADVKAFFNIYAENTTEGNESASVDYPAMDLLLGEGSNADENPYAGSIYENMTEAERRNTATAALAGFCSELSRMSADDAAFAQKAGMMIANTFGSLLGDSSMAVLQDKELTKPISADSVRNTVGMQSSDAMKEVSTVVTLDLLLIDADAVAETLTAEGIAVEAQAIEAIFSAAGTLVSKMNQGGEMDLADMAESVGVILDTLKATDSFGPEKTANLFTSIMQSETVRESANLDMATATLMANKGNEGNGSYTQTMTAVAESVSIADKLKREEDITDAELEELIRNLNPQTAGMLEIYMTPDRMVQLGVPEKYSGTASDMTVSTFSYMGREDLKDYEKEAQGLNQALDMFLAAKENKTKNKNLFCSAPNVNDGVLPTPDEFVNKLLGSEAICFSLVDVLTDGKKVTTYNPFGFAEKLENRPADQEALRTAILNHKRNHPEKDALVYEALAGMFNISLNG